MSESGNLTKKLEKQLEQNERLSAEVEALKQERDKKINEFQQRFEKERDQMNVKRREAEQRAQRIENKQTELLLSHEREKAHWDMQKTELFH